MQRINMVFLTLVALLISTIALAQQGGPMQADTQGQQIYHESIPGIYISINNKLSIPSGLPWPITGKSIKDISLYWNVEDAVSPGVTKDCKLGACGASGTTENHYRKHLGVDIAAASGTKVYPVQGGKVERVGDFGGGWGKFVVVSHAQNTWTSVYGHLDIDTTKIYSGLQVTTSTVLGTVKVLDPTVTGDINHLHFGIRAAAYDAKVSQMGYAYCDADLKSFVNPLTYLSRKGASIMDDNSASHTGTWSCSNSVDFYYGAGYRVLSGGSSGYATYRLSVPSDGSYKVYARWTPNPNRTTKATFVMFNGLASSTVTKNQQTISRGSWVELGTIDLAAARQFTVTLTNSSSTGYLVSDAILIEKQ